MGDDSNILSQNEPHDALIAGGPFPGRKHLPKMFRPGRLAARFRETAGPQAGQRRGPFFFVCCLC